MTLPVPTITGALELYKSPTATLAAVIVLFAIKLLFTTTLPVVDPNVTLAVCPIVMSVIPPTLNTPPVDPETVTVEVPIITQPADTINRFEEIALALDILLLESINSPEGVVKFPVVSNIQFLVPPVQILTFPLIEGMLTLDAPLDILLLVGIVTQVSTPEPLVCRYCPDVPPVIVTFPTGPKLDTPETFRDVKVPTVVIFDWFAAVVVSVTVAKLACTRFPKFALPLVILPVVVIALDPAAIIPMILPPVILPLVVILLEPAAIVPIILPPVMFPVPIITPEPKPKLLTLALPVAFNVPDTLTPVPVITSVVLPAAVIFTFPLAVGMYTFEFPFAKEPIKLLAVIFPVTVRDDNVPTEVIFG